MLDDPDAPGGTFVHWVVFRLKANLRALAAGRLPSGARQGRNDFGSPRYGGPCPPAGDRPHRYRFTVYALSKRLGLGAGSPHRTVRSRINRSTIGRGRLVGQYAR